METKILDYKILIEKELDKNGKDFAFIVSCPTLGLFEQGNSIDEAINKIGKLIKFHLESLREFGYDIPVEKDKTFMITNIRMPFSDNYQNFVYV